MSTADIHDDTAVTDPRQFCLIRSTALARRAQLENKIEQAVFFEGSANPLTFSLAVEKAASLEQALLAVSDLLVTSSKRFLRSFPIQLKLMRNLDPHRIKLSQRKAQREQARGKTKAT